jgi:hypothetical protein
MAAHVRRNFTQSYVKMALCLMIQVFRLVAMCSSVAYSHDCEEGLIRFQLSINTILPGEICQVIDMVRFS